MRKKNGLAKLIVGVGIGVGLGVLFAPRSGKETRALLKEKIDDLILKVKELDADEIREQIENKIREIKEELRDLDKEKVIAIAKEKAENIKVKITEMAALAKEKATPVIEKAVDNLRDTAIVVTKDTLKKLEDSKAKKTTKTKTTKKA